MDALKEKIEEVVKNVQNDKKFKEKFLKDPIKAVEDVLGIDLPDQEINKIIDAVKAKITVDNAKGLLDKAKGLFDSK